MKLGALTLAVILSTYVYNLNVVIKNVNLPVRVVGVDAGLVVSSEVPALVTLQLRGPLAILGAISNSPPSATINLSPFKEAGKHDIMISVPDLSGVEVIKAPPSVEIILKEKITKSVPIEVNKLGSLPADLIEKELTVLPSAVKVTGSQEQIAQIAHAVIDINLVGERRDVTRFVDVKLYDENFRELSLAQYILDSPKARYDLKVSSLSNVKLLRLFPDIKGEPPENYSFDVEIEPKHVAVPIDYLKNSETAILHTEAISLTGITESFEKDVKIDYPFKELEGLVKTAKVKVTIVDVTIDRATSISKKLEIVGAPTGVSVLVRPMYVIIGSNEISLLTDEERQKIRAVIDIRGLSPGEYTVRPQVILDPKIKNASVVPSEIVVEIALGGDD